MNRLIKLISNRIRDKQHVQSEFFWIAAEKTIEQIALIVQIKLLATGLDVVGFAEYSLIIGIAYLLGNVLLSPIQESFLRYYHRSVAVSSEAAAQRYLVRWFTVITGTVLLVAIVVSPPLSRLAAFETWSIAAGGAYFATSRWRMFAIQFHAIRRLRRRSAIENCAFLVANCAITGAIAASTASVQLTMLGGAVCAGVFAIIGCSGIKSMQPGSPPANLAELRRLVWTFGVPFSGILMLQWVQGSADRYIVYSAFDLAAAGVYVAAFQLTGVPYMFMLAVLRTLLLPIVYQRAHDPANPKGLERANHLLVIGGLLFAMLGLLGIPLAAWLGPFILKLCTSDAFVASPYLLAILAAARLAQCLGNFAEMFFAVQQRVAGSLMFRVAGAAVLVPAVFVGLTIGKLEGAAGGVAIANMVYGALLVAGPGGCLAMIREARRGAAQSPDAPSVR